MFIRFTVLSVSVQFDCEMKVISGVLPRATDMSEQYTMSHVAICSGEVQQLCQTCACLSLPNCNLSQSAHKHNLILGTGFMV